MTMTNEYIIGERSSALHPVEAYAQAQASARRRLAGEEAEPADDCDCILGPEEAIWLRLQHRRNLALIAAGGLALGLALALGLSAAWQIDRWAADWHYGLQDGLPMPPQSFEPSAYVAPGEAA